MSSANDALSVLNRLEQEAHSWELQRSALKEVRKVIEEYMKASKGLADMEVTKMSLESSIAGLGPRYEEQNDALRRDLNAARRDAEEEIAAIQSKVKKYRQDLAKISAEFDRKKDESAGIIAGLDNDIRVRENEIEKLSTDLQALKERHGLVV